MSSRDLSGIIIQQVYLTVRSNVDIRHQISFIQLHRRHDLTVEIGAQIKQRVGRFFHRFGLICTGTGCHADYLWNGLSLAFAFEIEVHQFVVRVRLVAVVTLVEHDQGEVADGPSFGVRMFVRTEK